MVSVGVDTGVNNVSDTAVRSVSAGRVVVARYWVATGRTGVSAGVSAGVTSAAEARCASVSASGADACCAMSAGCAVSASRASRAVKSVSCELF